MSGRNVFTALEETARKHESAGALHQPLGAKLGGGYRSFSWNEWVATSREIAVGLRSLGAQKGEVICILCETRAEFYIVDLAIMGAGCVAGALYTAYPATELAKNIIAIAPRFLFVETPERWSEVLREIVAKGGEIPSTVVLITGAATGVTSLSEVQDTGKRVLASDPEFFARVQEELSPSDPAILYLTSGATGEPKMSITSHAAVLANCDMAPEVLPIDERDRTVVFLPSAHIAQRIVLEIVPMRMGTPVWFSESLARLPNELRAIRPTLFLAPPRVWERMYSSIITEVKKRPPIAQKLFYRAMDLGLRAFKLQLQHKRVPMWMRLALAFADKRIFSTVRERLGGELRIAASGAAPLGRQLAEFFAAIGLPILEGYGLTEAGVLCLNPIGRPKPGTIGVALPGVQIRLAEDGELQVKTPCLFEGYYRDAVATSSVMTPDGWFTTGDIGEVDNQGYWSITGRKKELIVSSNGKKIYPARVESLFKLEPIVSQLVLIGDKKPYVTALLTVNQNQVTQSSQPVEKAVRDAVARVNRQLADFEQIRRFKILEADFSIERGELTPTMKIRRERVLANYASLVAELYLGKEEMH